MKLYYYKHPRGNFGDDLNAWLWPKLIPNVFEESRYHGLEAPDEGDTMAIFVGIGTLLNDQIPKHPLKAVFGTGTGYGASTFHANAKYYAVRGPLTAARLNLDPKLSVTDGAALLATLEKPKVQVRHKVSLIPHHGSSEESNRWEAIAAKLGINYINPANSPESVIQEILASERVVTEAMHGAILADTLRVPWTPYMTTRGRHEFKWKDWCASLTMDYEPTYIHPLYTAVNIKSQITNFIKQEIDYWKLKNIIESKSPKLSSDTIFYEKVSILQDKVEEFKRDFSSGYFDKII
jgi:succinoglycan biosynthesis protein ExoV